MSETSASDAVVAPDTVVTVTPSDSVPATSDRVVFAIVIALAVTVLAVIAGEVLLFISTGSHLPDLVLGMGPASLTAVGMLLASSKSVPSLPRRDRGSIDLRDVLVVLGIVALVLVIIYYWHRV